jgi:hypothetical protein
MFIGPYFILAAIVIALSSLVQAQSRSFYDRNGSFAGRNHRYSIRGRARSPEAAGVAGMRRAANPERARRRLLAW